MAAELNELLAYAEHLRAANRPGEAQAVLARAIDALRQQAIALGQQGQLQSAGACWEKILAIDPQDRTALCQLVVGRRKCCDWREFDAWTARLRETTEANLRAGTAPAETVLLSLSTSMDGAYQYRLAKTWADNRGKRYRPRYDHQPARRNHRDTGQITLGYISDEFRDHPIGLLLREYFKHHDRNRFRAIAYFDHQSDEADRIFQDVRASCQEWRLVAGLDHEALADLVYRDGVDIQIDLKGWREHNRLAVFAMRPAPLGVAFQGFPGTTGADYLDYIVVDECVVPEAEHAHYAEKLAYVGRCYQVNSAARPTYEELRAQAGTRREHGLPQDAIVLASFNQAYKLEPQMMTVWLEIMRRAERAVLWLLELNEACRANLRRLAAERGVQPERLVFAPWAEHTRHLARLTHADIGLDTRIYNGHATTSDSLWCRVPVVTLLGKHFASRVAASILREVGLDGLIANDLEEYRDLVRQLADDPQRRESLRASLSDDHLRATLFNTQDYVRRVEDLFQQMVDLHYQGQPPRMLRCRI